MRQTISYHFTDKDKVTSPALGDSRTNIIYGRAVAQGLTLFKCQAFLSSAFLVGSYKKDGTEVYRLASEHYHADFAFPTNDICDVLLLATRKKGSWFILKPFMKNLCSIIFDSGAEIIMGTASPIDFDKAWTSSRLIKLYQTLGFIHVPSFNPNQVMMKKNKFN